MDRKTGASNGKADAETIAVVGASARAAVMSVIRSGRTAVAADLFADADLERLCPVTHIENYPADLVEWLGDIPCDGWLYTGALENYPDLIDELATLRPLLGNSGSVLRRVRDPLLLQQVLAKYGLAFPETRTSSAGLLHDGTWLAKTYRGSSGSGVSALGNSTKNCVYFQRNITGDSGSAVFFGRELLGITRQLVGEAWTGARAFQYCGTLAPWEIPVGAETQLRRLGEVLVDEFELQGLFGADFVFDGFQPWVIEVNPRYTAATEVVERVSNINAVGGLAGDHHFPKRPPDLDKSRPSAFHGKAILFAKRATTVAPNFTEWALTRGDLADIPRAGTLLSPGQPVLTILVEAESFALILPALKSRMGEVDIRLWGGVGSCDWVS